MKFKEIFKFAHGRAHHYYESEESKRLYAKQLISLSEKCFWLVIAAFLPFFLNPTTVSVMLLSFTSFVFIWAGLSLRHRGLKIIDEINTGKITIITK